MKGFPLIRIVDDDQELLNSQKMLLETLGWEVAVYESALDFLARDNIDRPGCLILDVRMPGMTGIELQEELAKKGVGSLPIIFLSAHGSIAMAVHTLQHGAVDFLEKPVEPQKLLARVTNAIVSSLRQSSEDEEVAQMLSRVQKLSGREREIAGLVAKGSETKKSPGSSKSKKAPSRCTGPMRWSSSASGRLQSSRASSPFSKSKEACSNETQSHARRRACGVSVSPSGYAAASKESYDVIVVGSGVAGLTAAVSASENGAKRVLLIEKTPPSAVTAFFQPDT